MVRPELAFDCRLPRVSPAFVRFRDMTAPEATGRLRASGPGAPIARGGFGLPTFFVNGGEMYCGEDRPPPVEVAPHRAGAEQGTD